MRYLVPILLITITLTSGCKKKESVPHDEVLKNLSTNILKPERLKFNEHIDSLHFYVNEIHALNTSLENLTKAQEHLISTLYTWNNINLFETENIANTYIHFKIQKWPVDTLFILSNTENGSTVDSSLIEFASSKRKGLGAIEYLLFRNHALDSLQNSEQSRKYLYYCSKLLQSQKDQLEQLWTSTEYYAFESNQGSGVYTAMNFFYNNYVIKLEKMLHEKFGIPAGLDLNTNLDLNMVETNFAEISLQILIEDTKLMQAIFSGQNGKGLEDICRSNGGDNTADIIMSKWVSIQSKLEALPASTLKEAIVNNSSEISVIYQEIKSLLSYIKYDLPQYLETTLLYSSNDGD